jgi:integrase
MLAIALAQPHADTGANSKFSGIRDRDTQLRALWRADSRRRLVALTKEASTTGSRPGSSARRKLERTRTPGVYKRGGRFCVTFRDPSGVQRKRAAKTYSEAKNLKAALRADIARGEFRQLPRVTFENYAREWIDAYAGRTAHGLRESTRREYRRVIEVRAIPFFGRLRLSEIDGRDVARYVAEVAASGVSRNTTRLALAPVRALFATAFEQGLVRTNVAAGIRIPVSSTPVHDERPKALTEIQLRKVVASADSRHRLLVWLLGDTGLRVGEAVALTWNDIRFQDRRLAVRRRYYRGTLTPPKSRFGRRDIPLSHALTHALWRARQQSRGEDFVFSSRSGGPLNPRTAFGAVRLAGARAGVPWIGCHTLRHTCGTRLFRRGLNAKMVQLWLGHHSPAFSLATYVHILADDLPDPGFEDPFAIEINGDRLRPPGEDPAELNTQGQDSAQLIPLSLFASRPS